jgi:protein TonB
VEAPSLAIASSAPVLAAPAAPAVVTLAPGAGEIQPPSVISSVKPEYPEMALRSRTQGEVVALVDVDAKGTPVTIKVVSGPQMLYLSTMDAIRKWKFQPAMQDGHAVASQTRISIRYTLPR